MDEYVALKMKKQAHTLIEAEHRVKMVEAATQESDWLAVSSWESKQDSHLEFDEVSRIIRARLRAALGIPELKLVYVCGTDMALACGLHHGSNLYYCDGVVTIARPCQDTEDLRNCRDTWSSDFFLVETQTMDISSSEIRERMCLGQCIDNFVPPPVQRYIRDNCITCRKETW